MISFLPDTLTPKQLIVLHKAMNEQLHALRAPSPHSKISVLKALIQKITVSQNELTIAIKISGLNKLLGIVDSKQPSSANSEEDAVKTWTLPMTLRRYGSEVKLVLGDRKSSLPPRAHSTTIQGLQRALKKALIWNDAILSGKAVSLDQIAKQEKVTQRYIAQMIRLAYLAPDIQEAILQGKVPPTWTVDQFRQSIPLDWHEQRHRFPLNPSP